MPIDNLLFPATSSLECVKGGDNSPALTSVTIPSKYVIQGVSADLGLIITSANSTSSVVAQGVYCALNAVDNRPIWGAIIYNFGGFLYDQEGFQ